MPDVNIPLLRKAVEWAEAEAAKPSAECHWYQGDYVTPMVQLGRSTCGTAYCIAGYIGQALDERYAHEWDPAGLPRVDVFAQGALGLRSEEANDLFGGNNTIEDVRRIAEDIAGERL